MSQSETVHPPSFQRGEIGDAKLSAALRTLELTVKRKLDGVLQGNHLGLIPGPGSEPGESRLYQPGDDVRRMDWSVTARTTHPHVRQMIADRELETWLVVDMSASLDFGTAGCEKRDLAVAAAAAGSASAAIATKRPGSDPGPFCIRSMSPGASVPGGSPHAAGGRSPGRRSGHPRP